MGKWLILLTLLAQLNLSACTARTEATPSIPVKTSNAAGASADEEAAQSRIEDVELDSTALNKSIGYKIYLPPGYKETSQYPVLYLFSGYGGNRNSWFQLGINQAADSLIQSGQISALLIVSPDYDNSFGVNTTPGQGVNPGGVDEGRYEDYLIKEVVSHVDSHYSTLAHRDSRYIGGLSMGGFAALYLGFSYPDLFSKIGAHSAAIWDFSLNDLYTSQRDWLYPNEALRNQRDPFRLAETKDLRNVRVYLDSGDLDGLKVADEKLYALLNSKNIPAEWHVSSGGHDYSYWSSHVRDYLLFYAEK